MKKLLLLLSLVTLVSAACSRNVTLTQPTNQQAQDGQTVDMKGWKIYSSDKLGVEFSYPSNWIKVEDSDTKVVLSEGEGMSPQGMKVETSNLTDQQYLDKFKNGINVQLASTEKKSYSGTEWILYHFKYTGELEIEIDQTLALTHHEGTLYIVGADYLDDILTTFKFTSEQSSNGLKRICPQAWYDNQMPGIKTEGSVTQYLVVNGERAEVKDYDMVWIQANCPVDHPEIVY